MDFDQMSVDELRVSMYRMQKQLHRAEQVLRTILNTPTKCQRANEYFKNKQARIKRHHDQQLIVEVANEADRVVKVA